jgi:hypothetical protein
MVRLLLILAACGRSPDAVGGPVAPAKSAALPPDPVEPASPSAAVSAGLLASSCEPSALVRVGSEWIVGDNEDEQVLLRFDDAMRPLGTTPLASPVADIEAIAAGEEGLVVIGSHSANRHGKAKPDRHRVLLADGRVFAVDFGGFPESAAVNIEGGAVVGGDLVLGLRSPLAAGHAQLLVVDRRTSLGHITRVIPIDLGGAGVRELVPWRGGLLVISGPTVDGAEAFGLSWLARLDGPAERLPVVLPASAEGAWPIDGNTLRVVIDGDGKPGACTVAGAWLDVPVALPGGASPPAN